MMNLPPTSPQSPAEGPKRVRIEGNGRGFTVQFQSQSRVLGCLTALAGLTIGLVLAVTAGVVALLAPLGLLLWRGVRWVLAKPAINQPDRAHVNVNAEIIDVESTVLPPTAEKSQAPESRPGM